MATNNDTRARVMYRGYPLYLPEPEVLERFREAYPDMTNEELRAISGRSCSYNSRLGNYLGLEKSEAFKGQRQDRAGKAAAEAKKKGRGCPPKGSMPPQLANTCFKKGNIPWTKTATEEERKAAGRNLSKTWRAEYRRDDYGLPRKTHLHLKRWTRRQMQDRFYLVKVRHYIEVADLVFAYDDNTKRSPIKEKKAEYRYPSLKEWQKGRRNEERVTAIREWGDKQGGFKYS